MRNIFPSLLLSSLFLLTGCGGSSSEPGDELDPCVEGAVTHDITVQPTSPGSSTQPWFLLRPLLHKSGTSLLLTRRGDDDSRELAFLGPDGKLTHLVTVENGANFTSVIAPVALADGARCAVYEIGDMTLHLACDNGLVEDSKIEVETQNGEIFPIAGSGGGLTVYASTHASFTVVSRQGTGSWAEEEQYESSISRPTDATRFGAVPVACFISAEDHAVITSAKGATITSMGPAKTCKIAISDKGIDVLLDTGFATLPLSKLDAGANNTFDVAPVSLEDMVLAMGDAGGKPYAVYRDNDAKLQRVALDTGTVTALGDATDDSFSYQAVAGADRVVIVSSDDKYREMDTVTQTFRTDTRCTAGW